MCFDNLQYASVLSSSYGLTHLSKIEAQKC